MKLQFTPKGWADHVFWQETDRQILSRVNQLIRDTLRSPFEGIGKPEPLRGQLQGWWSRRITGEHRLVYRVLGGGEDRALEIASCRFLYR